MGWMLLSFVGNAGFPVPVSHPYSVLLQWYNDSSYPIKGPPWIMYNIEAGKVVPKSRG